MAKLTPLGRNVEPRRVHFKRQPNGNATITIDGHDVSGLVMDYEVSANDKRMTTLTVTFVSVAVDIDNPADEPTA